MKVRRQYNTTNTCIQTLWLTKNVKSTLAIYVRKQRLRVVHVIPGCTFYHCHSSLQRFFSKEVKPNLIPRDLFHGQQLLSFSLIFLESLLLVSHLACHFCLIGSKQIQFGLRKSNHCRRFCQCSTAIGCREIVVKICARSFPEEAKTSISIQCTVNIY